MIAGSLHPVTGSKLPVQIILTSGTFWTVPADWNSANNKVECIGAGRSGGGAYAWKNNLTLTPGTNVTYQIGTTSTTQSVADTWFVSGGIVKAAGSIGNTGGQAALCVGDVKYSGGSAGGGGGGSGGGGAAGPNGNGADGTSTAGGAGGAGFGGAGGTSASPAGGAGTEWGSAGSGGGGLGSGSGGLYGGGSRTGTPAPGVIVITYTP